MFIGMDYCGYFCVYVLSVFVMFRRFTYQAMVCIVPRALFYFRFVAIDCDCVVRLVTRASSRRVLEIYPAYAGTRPGNGLILNIFIFPMACRCFTTSTRANASVSRFTIAVNKLVRVRRIRVRNVPEGFLVRLDI